MPDSLICDSRSSGATYKVLRKLGKGGMAEVFLARQEGMAGLRRLAVIKRLLPQLSQLPDVVEMLLDEARIAAQLSHPNIVQIYELGQDQGQHFIAMEFVDGCDLATLARIERHRQSRVPLRLTLRAVSEAAMGLDFAHRQVGLDGRPLNLVHRDVSPHNIMCSREGAVKLTDFGVAKAVGKAQVTQVGVVKGKLNYMSPEQYAGGAIDHRSDIYSLGVILYQLTTGRLPRLNDDEAPVRRVFQGEVPRPTALHADYPRELEPIVMRALALDPERRHPDAATLRDELLELARSSDLLAFPKELAEYVNTLVPSTPLVVRELSHLADPASALSPEPPRSLPARQPGGRRESEDQGTAGPHGTQVASPVGRRRSAPGALDRPSLAGPRSSGTGSIQPPSSTGAVDADDEAPTVADTPVFPVEEPAPPSATDPRLQSAEARRARRRQRTAASSPSGEASAEHLERGGARDEALRIEARAEASQTSVDARACEPSQAGVEASTGGSLFTSARPEAEGQANAEALPDARGAIKAQTRARTGEPPALHRRSSPVTTWVTGLSVLLTAGSLGYVALSRLQPDRRSEPTRLSSPASEAGVINVLSNPSAAVVSIDGAQRCPSTPCQVAGLPLGRELVVTLRARGHTLWMQRMVLSPSEPKLLLRADLSPESPPPADAAPVSGATPPEPKRTAPGKATRRPSGKTPSRENLTVTDITSDQALLAVNAQPWVEVWIDGKRAGTTPIQLALAPGVRRVELKNPERSFSKTYRITARKGKKVKLVEILEPPSR